MANLFPVFDVPSVLAEDAEERGKYGLAPMFDVTKGDFVTDGSGRILLGNGYDTWVLWCTKTILTQRWAHYAYGGNTGVEADEAFKMPDRKARESAFERTITEALLADPAGRTVGVRDFDFGWERDALRIGCTVMGRDGNSATVTATVSA